MYPIILKIGPISVYSYGLMLAIGFALGAYLAQKRAAMDGLKPNDVIDLLFWVIISGIIGARLLYVLENLGYYKENPLEMAMINRGGLVLYGGVIVSSLVTIIFTKIRGMDLWKTADLLAPYIALGQAIGRIGCFLNGCCYGKPTSFFLAVRFPGHSAPVHPTQLYESAAMFGLFAFLLWLRGRKRFDCEVFYFYIILYSAARFFIEFLRGDNPIYFAGLTISQLISAALFSAAAIALFVASSKTRKK